MSVFIQRACAGHPPSARRVLGAADAAVGDGRMEPAPSAFSELVFGGPRAYGGWGSVCGIWRQNRMWRCIRRMLPEAWKSHLAVEGYFYNIKGSRMVSCQHSEGDGMMCTCVYM